MVLGRGSAPSKGNSSIPTALPSNIQTRQLKTNTVPSPPRLSPQYSSKTLRKPPSPTRKPAPHCVEVLDSEESWSTVVSRAKTLPAKPRRSPPRLSGVNQDSSPKGNPPSSPSALRDRPSTRLRAAFVTPKKALPNSPPARHGSITKPRAPVLMTQLRAQRHKLAEDSSKFGEEDMWQKTIKRKSNPPESGRHRPSIASLFSDSPPVELKIFSPSKSLREGTPPLTHPIPLISYKRTPVTSPRHSEASGTDFVTATEHCAQSKPTSRLLPLDFQDSKIPNSSHQTWPMGQDEGLQLSSSNSWSEVGTLPFTDELESAPLIPCRVKNDSCRDGVCDTSVGDFSEMSRSGTPDQQLEEVSAPSRQQYSPDASVVHHRQPSIALSLHSVGSANAMKVRCLPFILLSIIIQRVYAYDF
jgi:hypothetical protein